MITKKQHVDIWEKIRRMRWQGLTVYADGIEVVSATIETEGYAINLSDKTRLTHRSYRPETSYSELKYRFRCDSVPIEWIK
jgi:hypothetical protein